jgi:hypothetical protein
MERVGPSLLGRGRGQRLSVVATASGTAAQGESEHRPSVCLAQTPASRRVRLPSDVYRSLVIAQAESQYALP